MLEMWRDPVVVKYFGGVPSTAQECWSRLLRYAGLWPLVGYGYWRVRERGTGRLVGEVGFAEFRRDMTPSLVGTPEAGWVLASWAHGQGFAREATEAILAWADDELGADRTVCMIDPENAASLTLAARLGYRVFAEGCYGGRTVVLLERFVQGQGGNPVPLEPRQACVDKATHACLKSLKSRGFYGQPLRAFPKPCLGEDA
jgi:RimJ/RimL family protein N-acetyltransferase